VLILALLLSAAIITFMRRAVIDTMIIRNRDAAAQTEALARGGVRLAMALLEGDAFAKNLQRLKQRQTRIGGNGEAALGTAIGATLQDSWARAGLTTLITPEGGELRIQIFDTSAHLNLNALVPYAPKGEAAEGDSHSEAEEFLVAFLEKVIDESGIPPGEQLYDPRDLAGNLIDYLDSDDVRVKGGFEDDYYQLQSPPYRSANRPLLSVDELRMVEGFDAPLVEAIRPYVTVYPLVGGKGINLNTAPPHVLAAVYHGTSGNYRLASEDTVRRVLQVREEGKFLCAQTETDSDRCTLVTEVVEGSQYPETRLPAPSKHFTVLSQARLGDVSRRVEAVVDRSEQGAPPRLLSWRVR
jgi:type II secretory pathway component PulK